jgi:hypothetical protein
MQMNLRSLPRCGDDGIYFTHGWSNIRTCYVDAEGKGGWVLLTYIRPQLFVLVLKDRYYRDLIVKQLYPHMCLKLSRSLFGADQNLGWGGSVFMPDCHDSENFAHCFVVILSDSHISSKSLVYYFDSSTNVLTLFLFLISVLICVFFYMQDYDLWELC